METQEEKSKRWARQKEEGRWNSMTTPQLSEQDRENLDWAKQDRQHIETRNKVAALVFMFAFSIGASIAINYYGLPTLTSFLQGFFFEMGTLASIFGVDCLVGSHVFKGNDAVAVGLAAELVAAALVAGVLAATVVAGVAAAIVLATVVAGVAAAIVLATVVAGVVAAADSD